MRARTGAYQAVERNLGSVGSECTTHSARHCRRRERPRGAGGDGGEEREGYARGVGRCTQRGATVPYGVPQADSDDAGPCEAPRRTDGATDFAGGQVDEAVRGCGTATGRNARLGVDSGLQIVAEVGPRAEVFPRPGNLCSWVGSIPGEQISAERNASSKSPKGNRQMRRILTEAVEAAVKQKGNIFEVKFRKFITHMDYQE